MQLSRFTRVLAFTMLTITLGGSGLLANWQIAGAYQNDPTPTPQPSGTPEAGSLPLTQGDLARFTGFVARPNGMVWHDERIFVVCAGDQTIYELYGTSGRTDTYIHGIRDAHSLYAENRNDGAVHLWVPDYETGSLLRVTPSNVDVVASGMFGPWGIAYLSPTTFLVSSRVTGQVELVTRSGQRVTLIGGLSRPTGLDHDYQHLYVANSGNPDRAIEWYYLQTVRNSETVDDHLLVSGLSNVMTMRIGPDEHLYFAYEEEGLGVIGRVDPDECLSNDGCTADEVERVVVTNMEAPLAGLTFSPDGRMFFHARYGENLYWVRIAE